MDFFFAPDLRGFIDDNPVIDLDTAVDFVCEKFDINLTDSLLDDIAEVFFEHEDVKFRLGLDWYKLIVLVNDIKSTNSS